MSQIATPLPAATVALLRDGPEELEVFMTVRAATMAFQPNAAVFPGGKVADHDHQLLPDDPLGAFKIAAIRETFEEAGVLLATHNDNGQVLQQNDVQRFDHWRQMFNEGQADMASFGESCKLAFDHKALHLTARWITPEAMPKRFDSYFFLAAMPPAQTASHDGSEAVTGKWHTPQEVLDMGRSGDYLLVPPTYWTLKDLSAHATLQEALENLSRTHVEPVMPVVTKQDGKPHIHVPGR